MDGNKDDALRSLRIGKEALEAGDLARAIKFISKARRLDPTLPVDDLLSAIKRESEENSPPAAGDDRPSGSPPSKPSAQSSVRHRVPSGGSSSAPAPSSPSVAYTDEQVAIVREIRKKKDYYEILGVEKTCTVEDVRKAYRKLSLKVHPDKNKAPGAEEAFKAVSKAFQCLGNEENKQKYDITGSDEPVYERRAARRGAHFNGGFYEAEFDADEIFRNFFYGGGMAPATQFRGFSYGPGMGARMDDNGSGGFNLRALLQLLPVLLILFLNFFPGSDPMYALSRSYPYQYRFVTPKGVNYFVKKSTFEQEYPYNSPERVALENAVEQDYFNILAEHCRHELQRKQWGFIHETPHCERLRSFEVQA